MKAVFNRNGHTLVLVIMVMMILLLLTSTLSTLIYHQQQNVLREEYFTQAFNAAEAGIETTIAKIISESKWYDSLPVVKKSSGTFENILETEITERLTYEVKGYKKSQGIGTSLVIQSVGNYTIEGEIAAQKTLHSTVGVFQTRDYLRGLSVLPVEPECLELNSNLILDGDLVVNGDIPASGPTINGSIYASGKKSDYIPPFPDLDKQYFKTNAKIYNFDTSFGSPVSLIGASEKEGEEVKTVTEYDGLYYVDGDITIMGSFQGTALFFATGCITVNGNLAPTDTDGNLNTDAGSLTLVAMEDVDIKSNTAYANIVASGSLHAEGGAKLYGSVCVTGVDFGGGAPIQFNYLKIPLGDDHFLPVQTKTITWEDPVF